MHAPRRKARGVFCHVRGYHQKLRLFKPSPQGEGFARPDHPARGRLGCASARSAPLAHPPPKKMDRQSWGTLSVQTILLPFGVAAMALRTAMGTVAAAGGFPLPLLADQGKGNEGDNGDEYNRNQNRREVCANPAEHGKSLLCVCEFWKGSGLERGGFLVGTHQHVNDAG